MNKKKLLGQTFTEYKEVSEMISMSSLDILNSKIMEPSFGDGAFLSEIIRRIIKVARDQKISNKKIKKILEENIWGYEIDTLFFNLAMQNINQILVDMNFQEDVVFKNLKNSTAFEITDKKFDLIIGNPPYVRIQNFDSGIVNVKNNLKRTNGNTDLFLMFIDFYLEKLNENGELIFIVPNSFGKSRAALQLRKYMFENGVVTYIDFEDKQLFASASVYSCIFKFKKNSKANESTFQVGYGGAKHKIRSYGIFEPTQKKVLLPDLQVRNGIATLADKVFIFKNDFPQNFEKQYIVNTFKASRKDEKYFAIFPYKIKGNKIERFESDLEFKKIAPNIYNYLEKYKKDLLERSLEKKTKWFEYGRSQAINDLMKSKFIIDTLIRPTDKKLVIRQIPKKSLVFSGLYTTSDKIIEYNTEKLVKSLRFRAKDMRGGYKKISSTLLKNDK